MRDTKDYKNTVEFASEKLYNFVLSQWMKDLEDSGEFDGKECVYTSKFSERPEDEKNNHRCIVITVLNAVNYFEGKTCSDCGYFDPVENICFGEDREHKEQPDSPICETFAPKGLTEEST